MGDCIVMVLSFESFGFFARKWFDELRTGSKVVGSVGL